MKMIFHNRHTANTKLSVVCILGFVLSSLQTFNNDNNDNNDENNNIIVYLEFNSLS